MSVVKNLQTKHSKNSIYYIYFKTKFHSRAKGNPWAGRMMCRPDLDSLLIYNSGSVSGQHE
jgi:hypothetical protein